MKILYSWLREYLQTELQADEVAAVLTAAGLEVEGLERSGGVRGGLEGLVVAQVLTCAPHPDSDHLKVTTVSTGEGKEPLTVVCGAPNVAAGQKVILAQIGTTLYPKDDPQGKGFKIKKSKIRGVESHGMLCAEDEIGVGDSHQGIIVLDAAVKVGTPAAEVFDIQTDEVLEIGLTPNRVDAASHYGVARDLAACLAVKGVGVRAQLPELQEVKTAAEQSKITVTVQDPAGAPRYMGLAMSGVRIGPSPEWMQARLRAVGLTPRNNVVDITNYVMLECGQPLHAFDLSRVEGGQIVVRRAGAGERLTTLDGVERALSAEDLVIADANQPMCLAGVFGGLQSAVSEDTTAIFIESAYFDAVTVRKTARRYGLSTDSSFRFERGADPQMAPYALKRAAMLVSELAGAAVSSEIIDRYPQRIEPHRFEFDLSRLGRLIGEELPPEAVRGILASLEVKIEQEQGLRWTVAVPPYRVDVRREADLSEEVLRIWGYDRIAMPHYIKNVITTGNQQTTDRLVETVSDLLVSLGGVEIMGNSLTRASYYEPLTSCPVARCVRILNPLSTELNVMRQTLLFNALEAVVLNVNRQNADLKLFEVGNCYYYDPSAAVPEAVTAAKGELKSYSQRQKLGLTVTGLDVRGSWREEAQKSGFYTLKALIERILGRLGVNPYEGRYESLPSDLYGEAVRYILRGKELFQLGVVAPQITKGIFDLKQPVYYAELDLSELSRIAATVRVQSVELSKFPAVHRDLALLVDKSLTFTQLRDAAYSIPERKLLRSVGLFDVYEGDKLPAGKKSYALNFVLEDVTKTLTDTEIDRIMSSIATALEKATGAQIRS